MTPETFVIILGDDSWRIGVVDSDGPQCVEVDAPADAESQEKARKAFELLEQMGYRDQPVALAIPSASCLCAKISTADLPRRNQHQTMIYKLEEKLPVAAEGFVADFVPAQEHALGVCVQVQDVAPVVESLEACGVNIDVISPMALLALQSELNGNTHDGCDILLWAGDAGYCDLFVCTDACPVAWYRVLADPSDITRQIKFVSTNNSASTRVACCKMPRSIVDAVKRLPEVELVDSDDKDMAEAAVTEANRVLTGKQAPLINLRRDALAASDPFRPIRGPLIATAVAAVLCLFCLNGVLWWWSAAYKSYTAEYESRQQAIFTELFPGARVPLGVKSRLASERRRLGGLRGQETQVPDQAPVLLYLRDALSQLPRDTRYRILEMQINDQRLLIEGQAQTHGGADAIAAALNRGSVFRIEPPRTENLAGQGISFTIRGTTKGGDISPVGILRAEVPK